MNDECDEAQKLKPYDPFKKSEVKLWEPHVFQHELKTKLFNDAIDKVQLDNIK